MSSLHALLLSRPSLQTRKGLIILGLQNDFVSPDGKLPVGDTGFLDCISHLVPAFREFGDIIWVRSEFESNRPVSDFESSANTIIVGGSLGTDDEPPSAKSRSAVDRPGAPLKAKEIKDPSPKSSASLSTSESGEDDEELFLTRTASREPCCLRGTDGANFSNEAKALIQAGTDLQVVKSHYSAFSATSLLLTLRSRLITDLFVCGSLTNISVYATAMDAARYGIKTTLVEDCLGYRKRDRHDLAIRQLRDVVEADVRTWKDTIAILQNPEIEEDCSDEEGDEDELEEQRYEITSADEEDDLEVDSDESEEEMSLPFVRRTGPLEQRVGLHSNLSAGRHSLSTAAEPRSNISQNLRMDSLEPREHHGAIGGLAHRNIQQKREETINTKIDASASHHRGLGKTDSPDSSATDRPPWLDLLPSRSGSQFNTTIRPKHRGLAGLSAAADLGPSTVAERGIMMVQAQEENAMRVSSKPLFGEDKEEESCGSRIVCDLLPDDRAQKIFEELNAEVNWQRMYHQTGEVPRLVCCQGTVDNEGSMPVYRHPSDQTIPLDSWTPAVDRVRQVAEKVVGHRLNHALIQLYRGGNDYISEHSDKTLDIARGSNIVNVSFGAQRTMRLRTKRSAPLPGSNPTARTTYRVPMPHNSMLIMSLPTNAQYLHGINWDRRPACELVEAEKAYGGHRISLTFRNIATFLNKDLASIWGQGAIGKTIEDAQPVVNGDPEQSERLVRAFGAENQASTIVWEEIYGEGFNVLHLK